ncbi:MAG TPA: VWA domain-containing protein [Pyrinomonadaceae bacterium]|nr:VWA domain-containing protein [Pyrinomonadaceae bacterium]
MKSTLKKSARVFALIILFLARAFSQEAAPTPPDEQPIKIPTEEVLLNVTAQTASGKFVSTLKPDDLLIVESGTPQKIESMKRVPASVLVLLDTGGNLNFAKNLNMTRLTAKLLVEKISAGNSVAVMQSYDKIETVTHWTENRDAVQSDLDKKLFSGNRSRFSDSLSAAIEMFKSRPPENRHLVFIGDGLDSLAGENERQKALQNLLAANITVHVIAYNRMEARRAKPMTRPFQIGEEIETPRLPEYQLELIIQTLPPLMRDGFRRLAKAERLFIVRLDHGKLKLAKQKLEQWKKSETELQAVAEDTGGMFQAPEELETMWRFAQEIAQAVDSQYVITYVPTKPFAETENGEPRKIRVGTHCEGVVVRSRQKIVSAAKKSN